MRLGILSDSHGRAAITARAVALLEAQGADLLIHLGDVETEAVIDELVGHPARIVFGNCDWDIPALTRYAAHVGVAVDHPTGRLEADGKVIAYTHGHIRRLMDAALSAGVDYLLHGHTHVVRDERDGRTRIINPGALFRASRYTAAVLDVAGDRLSLVEIPQELPAGRPDG